MKRKYKRKFDRSLLPSPARYYFGQFPGMKIKSEWISVSCCFHEHDANPSLSISMINGNFRCFACGAKGCDIISFHQQRYDMSFMETVDFFGAWASE